MGYRVEAKIPRAYERYDQERVFEKVHRGTSNPRNREENSL